MSNLQNEIFNETKQEAQEENRLKRLYNLPAYEAVETGAPCLALDDVEKMLIAESDYILKASKCGLVFTGEYDYEGLPVLIGTVEQRKVFNNLI